jgi:hypothetical protein
LRVSQSFLQGRAQYLGSIGIATQGFRDRADQALVLSRDLKADADPPVALGSSVIGGPRSLLSMRRGHFHPQRVGFQDYHRMLVSPTLTNPH